MELKELYSKFKTLNELSQLDPSLIESRIRAGMEGKIRNARSELVGIEDTYKAKVADDCAIIAVKGKYGKEFAEISSELKTLPVDFLSVIDTISDSILSRGGKDQYTGKEHLMVMDELNKIKMNHKLSHLPLFQAKFDGVNSGAGVKEGLLIQLTKQYGGQLYSIVTRGEIGRSALDMGFTGKSLPVILYNYIVPLDSKLLPEPKDVISVDSKPTKKSVKETLMEIKQKAK